MPDTCRKARCGATTARVEAVVGPALLVDVDPDPKGTVWVEQTRGRDVAHELSQDAVKGMRASGIPLYRLHAKTCTGGGT